MMMRKIMWLFVVLPLLVLASCGGENKNDVAQGAESFVSMMSAEVSPMSTSASTTVTADMIMDWAERTFPELFPRETALLFPAIEYEGVTYNARAYVGAWETSYLGITADGRIFGLGDFTGGILQQFETIEHWADQVLADLYDDSNSFYFIQSRNLESGNNSSVTVYASLERGLDFSDIVSIQLLNDAGTTILETSDFGAFTDFHNYYRCLSDPCSFSRNKDQYYWTSTNKITSAGNYTFTIILTTGDEISQVVYYPGPTNIPFISSTSIDVSVLENGDISVAWDNPTSQPNWNLIDQIRVVLRPEDRNNQKRFQLILSEDKETATVPFDVLSSVFNESEINNLELSITTNARDDNGYPYARGESSRDLLASFIQGGDSWVPYHIESTNAEIIFKNNNGKIIPIPSDAMIRVVPNTYADIGMWNAALHCVVEYNGSFLENCFTWIDQIDYLDSSFSNPDETFQFVIYRNTGSLPSPWGGGDTYKFVGDRVDSNWNVRDVEVFLND